MGALRNTWRARSRRASRLRPSAGISDMSGLADTSLDIRPAGRNETISGNLIDWVCDHDIALSSGRCSPCRSGRVGEPQCCDKVAQREREFRRRWTTPRYGAPHNRRTGCITSTGCITKSFIWPPTIHDAPKRHWLSLLQLKYGRRQVWPPSANLN
jgi:hypothetical protein